MEKSNTHRERERDLFQIKAGGECQQRWSTRGALESGALKRTGEENHDCRLQFEIWDLPNADDPIVIAICDLRNGGEEITSSRQVGGGVKRHCFENKG